MAGRPVAEGKNSDHSRSKISQTIRAVNFTNSWRRSIRLTKRGGAGHLVQAGARGASFAYRNCRVLNEIIGNLAGRGEKNRHIITKNEWDGGCSGRTK